MGGWIQFGLGALFIIIGLMSSVTSVMGIFRFRFVLNRMHSAAIGDTLAILFVLTGLIVINGFNFTSLKLLLIIVFLWIASPVSSHLISSLISMTHSEKVIKECGYIDMTEDDAEDKK